MDNRLTDISIHRALSIAMSLAYSFYQGPKNTCNAKSNNSKNDLGSHKDNNVSLQKHTQKKNNVNYIHTHWRNSSIKWRLPNICLTLFVNSPVRYAEQDSNESDCSSDVNWSSRSRGDIYVNKRNNCIIQVSWKVESISYVSGPVVSRKNKWERDSLYVSDIWDSDTAVDWDSTYIKHISQSIITWITFFMGFRLWGKNSCLTHIIFLSQTWASQQSSFQIYLAGIV